MKKITGRGINKHFLKISKFELVGLLLCSISLLMMHCNDPKEDCLDVNAKNYDVSADDPCEDCCQYPTFTVSYIHQMDSTVLHVDSIYRNNLDQLFQVHDFSYFLTNFQFIGIHNTGTNIVDIIDTDTLQLYNATDTTIVVHNFSLVTPNTRSDVLGLLAGDGMVDSLKFDIGIAVATDSLSHPDLGVIQQQAELWKEHFGSTPPDTTIVIATDSIGNPTETLDLVAEKLAWGETPFLYKEITLPYTIDIVKSIDYSIRLSIDYKKWFKKLDLIEHTKAEMLDIMLDSIPGSIKIVE